MVAAVAVVEAIHRGEDTRHSHNTINRILLLLMHTEVGRLALLVVVVVPCLALVLVDTHTDPADLHMHEEGIWLMVLWLWRISPPGG